MGELWGPRIDVEREERSLRAIGLEAGEDGGTRPVEPALSSSSLAAEKDAVTHLPVVAYGAGAMRTLSGASFVCKTARPAKRSMSCWFPWRRGRGIR